VRRISDSVTMELDVPVIIENRYTKSGNFWKITARFNHVHYVIISKVDHHQPSSASHKPVPPTHLTFGTRPIAHDYSIFLAATIEAPR